MWVWGCVLLLCRRQRSKGCRLRRRIRPFPCQSRQSHPSRPFHESQDECRCPLGALNTQYTGCIDMVWCSGSLDEVGAKARALGGGREMAEGRKIKEGGRQHPFHHIEPIKRHVPPIDQPQGRQGRHLLFCKPHLVVLPAVDGPSHGVHAVDGGLAEVTRVDRRCPGGVHRPTPLGDWTAHAAGRELGVHHHRPPLGRGIQRTRCSLLGRNPKHRCTTRTVIVHTRVGRDLQVCLHTPCPGVEPLSPRRPVCVRVPHLPPPRRGERRNRRIQIVGACHQCHQ